MQVCQQEGAEVSLGQRTQGGMQSSAKSGGQVARAISQAHGPHSVEKVRALQHNHAFIGKALLLDRVQGFQVLNHYLV